MESCCEPLCCEPLNEADATAMARRLQALSDPTRQRMFSMLSSQSEHCACDLADPLGVGQPTVSHHLKILHEAGLVEREQRGKWAYYSVAPDALRELSAFLDPAALTSGA
ncbi:MAG: transcriptional regulator [Armatimonadetes bacterium]|nr:MAG: transcriptional regulator [Armatimonadota bacterium]